MPGTLAELSSTLYFRQHERLAEVVVEAAGDVAADFDVLHLVGADGHDVGVVGQNVGRHQHRIREQPRIGGQALGDFIFVGDAALQAGPSA